MNETKRLIKNTGLIAVGKMSTKVVSFFLLPLYTALLSAEELGTVDYIISISTFCVPFVSFLMDEAVFRFLIDCKNNDESISAISSSMFLVVIGNLLFLLVGIPIMIAIHYKYTVYMILYVLSAVLTMMTAALLRGFGKTSKYVLLSFLVSLITVVMNVVLIAFLKIGLVGMLISSIAAHTVVPLIFIFSMRLWEYFRLKSINKPLLKEMVKYSVPLIPNKISWSIINLSDRIIIMNFINSTASGLYAAAYKFPNLVDTVYGFFYQSWKESSARALQDSGTDGFYNSIYKYLKKFMFSFVLCLTAFMPIIFNILINKSYNEAIMYIPPLVLSTYFANISGFYGGIFTAYKDTKIMGTTTVVSAVINLGVHFALINYIGLYAAALSTFVSNIVVYVYRKIKVKKYINLKENNFENISAVIVMGLVWILFYSNKNSLHVTGYIVSAVYSVIINHEMLRKISTKLIRRVKH
ncbi:MAG: oligosaccharide flippase family protein [Oscillospiraceae bacterium]|nr:oligosaccharide flippase family protein [Oscillospiraceae bacterium]